MTNQDAIDYLTALWNSDHLSVDESIALGMAIKALETPPNDNWEGYSSRLWKAAYERGKAEQTSVLGKIRAEIVHLHDWTFSREEILRIIDKYMVESEDKT